MVVVNVVIRDMDGKLTFFLALIFTFTLTFFVFFLFLFFRAFLTIVVVVSVSIGRLVPAEVSQSVIR
jgi:hypothetical protein